MTGFALTLKWVRFFFFVLLLSGCACAQNPIDPFEPFNRSMYTFNTNIDTIALKPISQCYQKYTPQPIQTGVTNFFSNLGDVWTGFNNILVGEFLDGLSDCMRFIVNTTFGIGGLFDVASKAGMLKHKKDFGETLGVWGVPAGPYVVLPIFGPSTVRDTLAFPINWKADPFNFFQDVAARNTLSAIRIINLRASLLGTTNLIDSAAIDPYLFTRDAYLQHRATEIEGDPTPHKTKNDEDNQGWSE